MTAIPPPPDHRQWEAAAQEFQQDLLVKVQDSAGVWSGAVATLLGLFGTVALVTGTDDVTKVSEGLRPFVLLFVLLTGLAAGASLILAMQAQQLPNVRSRNWNGEAYRIYVLGSAERARARLHWSKFCGITAALLLFVTGFIILVDSAEALGTDGAGTRFTGPTAGQIVYRIYDDSFAPQFGRSWTPIDPRALGAEDFRVVAGLPDVRNLGTKLVYGTLDSPSSVREVRPALPMPPGPNAHCYYPGGIVEYVILDPGRHLSDVHVEDLTAPFGGKPPKGCNI